MNYWMIEGSDGYRSGCVKTQAEAIYRLEQQKHLCNSGDWYLSREARLFFETSPKPGTIARNDTPVTYKVVKL